MRPTRDFEVIRDPLWNNIRIAAGVVAVVDSPPVQRLRYIRQLGHAYLVYPGATHTRFEHALGTYHLARRTLWLLAERGELGGIPDDEVDLVRLAALLHDIGHYPFSHALEEAGLPHHETLAARHLAHDELVQALDAFGISDVGTRLGTLIRGQSGSPLQGLVSGSIDLDKIEYLTRDARSCGVPYGTVDVDRLVHSITLLTDDGGDRRVGVYEKGVSALESLLFAKYQMYRNVYWHHAVRSATAMFKRLVRAALDEKRLDVEWIAEATDEALMERVRTVPGDHLAARLRSRQLYKRAVDLQAGQLPAGAGEWIAGDPALVTRVEDRLAHELGGSPGDILLDFPAKPEMVAVDLPLLLRNGDVVTLTSDIGGALLGIRRIADELHTSARRLRVFVATPTTIEPAGVLALAERSAQEVVAALGEGRALLRGV
ncbi:MAG: HD domain-containing protein [Gemmatimonadales bacterium]|jgi:HD superfamily phosphohydrolase